MTTRQKVAEELLKKEERVSAWEKYSINNGTLDRDYCETPNIEYWYMD